ncbi:hypothetical protein DYB28_004860, partial [Aphanomyces astaci]
VLLNTHDTYIKILKKKPSTRSKTDLVTLATFLQTLKFFRGLPKTFVQELCTIIDLINVDANTTIFREGEIGKLFYVILSGAVDVKISAVDQRGGTVQTKLVNLGEGSHFGDLALMKKDGLRSATVVSTHSCELLIIAEKDYNSILKKLQKEDMQKRMALLDKIPIFQSVEWTSELMQELSYVLMEQRLAAGTALHFRILWLMEATYISATGKNFNEPVIRSETATANTPIEVLALSKYDVFNRLSRTARETLRGHTHRHKHPVVVFDQLYKTLKWDQFKAKVVHDEVHTDRLNKVLPTSGRYVKPTKAAPATTSSLYQRGHMQHAPLIEGNELLLLSPMKPTPPVKTLASYTLNYNPDITTQDRPALLRHLHPVSPQPAFRLVGHFATSADARDRAAQIEAHENLHSYRSFKADPHPVEFFVIETNKHALVPPSMDRLMSPQYCNQRLHEYLHDHGNLKKLHASFCQLTQSPTGGHQDIGGTMSSHAIARIMHDLCGHLECLHLKKTPTTTLQLQDIEHNHMPLELKQPSCNFACISTLIVGDGTEPSLCVYGCFPTEADATAFAEHGFPNELSDQALLCVVPMYEWIYFEDATDWCLQMRKSQDRHNLAVHKKELHAIQQQPAAVAPVLAPHEQGQRLHQLVCSHMGMKAAEKDSDMKAIDDEAYTTTLEQKMEALHDILSARHQSTGLGSSLQKMQKVQRFGHIMKMRLQKGE